ncbi:MAG: hypothetical protein IJV74_06395 [Clostridia bacterium]|nr:hypothetical protein [Clostridia bacterium]
MTDICPEDYDTRAMLSLYRREIKNRYDEEEQRLEDNLKALKKDFTEQQRMLLLDITDDKDLIRSKDTLYYYIKGFRRAIMIMAECFPHNE